MKHPNVTFFIGWILSPFTSWNDAFVNIPLAYICARITAKFIPVNFLLLTIIFYWLTNIVGIVMIIASGKSILVEGKGIFSQIINLILTMVAYSIILFLLFSFFPKIGR